MECLGYRAPLCSSNFQRPGGPGYLDSAPASLAHWDLGGGATWGSLGSSEPRDRQSPCLWAAARRGRPVADETQRKSLDIPPVLVSAMFCNWMLGGMRGAELGPPPQPFCLASLYSPGPSRLASQSHKYPHSLQPGCQQDPTNSWRGGGASPCGVEFLGSNAGVGTPKPGLLFRRSPRPRRFRCEALPVVTVGF